MGQNLTYQKLQLLFSEIGPEQLAIYTDGDGKKKLIIRDKGIELCGGANALVSKGFTDNFMKKAVLITQTKNTPAETGNVEYGVRIVGQHRTPAYIDNSEYWDYGKFYGDIHPNLSTFGDAEVITMDDKIIDMIVADTGRIKNSNTPSGAIVRARRAYTVVDSANTDASGFTITWPDGNVTTFATATTFANGQLGEQLMADTTVAYGSTVGALLEAYQIDDDTYVITSREPGLKFQIGTAIDSTISTPGILLDSKYDDIIFKIEFDDYEWGVQGLNMTKLASTAFNTALNAHVAVDGTVTEITAATDQDTQRDAISAITGVTALNDGTAGFNVASLTSVETMMINFPVLNKAGNDPLTASASSVTYESTGSGKFSVMNADDVQREFAARDHAGHLQSAIRGNFATVAGAEYTMFTCKGVNTVGAIHGASHSSSSSVTVQLYIPTAACRGNLWDASDNATGNEACSGTPDITIEELLANWAS